MLRAFLFLVLLGLLTSPVWIALLALESSPLLRETASLSVDDVANARRLLKENDPRRLHDGQRHQVRLSERELNLLLAYLLPEGQTAEVSLAAGLLRGQASLRVPTNPVGNYLNITLDVRESAGVAEPGAMRIGKLRLPTPLVTLLAKLGNNRLSARLPEYAALRENLESVHIDGDGLRAFYRWDTALGEQLESRGRELIMLESEQRRTVEYYEAIAGLARTLPGNASLASVLGPLFGEALIRSIGGADPVAENRALLLALGVAVQGARLDQVLGVQAATTARVRGLRVTLRGRRDLAQHFAVSAALAAAAGSEIANVIGVFKEVSDSQGGSGFSFVDLLADRAGVALAERAIGPRALELQRAMSESMDEQRFMPSIDNLPEGLGDLEFRGEYEDLDSDAYRLARSELQRRIDSLPLYR